MAETAGLEDWKTRYRELLGELEHKENHWQSLEATLRGVATRLAITAMGRDPHIDTHLSRILDALKGKRAESEIGRFLEQLASEVLRHENSLAANEALDLSEFVANLNLSASTQKQFIDQLESELASDRVQALSELAVELNALLVPPSGNPLKTNTETAQEVVNAMARHMEGVPELEQAVEQLKDRLADGTSQEDIDVLLKNLAAAVSDIIKSIGEEKQELESFLVQVTEQLSQFEQWAQGNQSDSLARQQNTDLLERSVEKQVGGLQSDMESSSEMSDLKQRVQSRLNSIASQLTEFRKTEEQRTTEAGKRNALLLEEVNRLKVRTAELAVRCDDQQEKLMHDALTGVHTRFAYDQRLQEEFQRWKRHGQSLSFSIWDLDKFKSINDSFGHQTGDRLLAVVANMLSESTRVEDFVARIGGEEFVILFPATDLETAHALSDRLRKKIAGVSFHVKGQPVPVTVSCGVTEFRADDTPETVYERADQALYASKHNGRNLCTKT